MNNIAINEHRVYSFVNGIKDHDGKNIIQIN